MTAIEQRNAATVEAALKEMTAHLYEQAKSIQAQQKAIASLVERLIALERMVVTQRASLTGHGPTVQ